MLIEKDFVRYFFSYGNQLLIRRLYYVVILTHYSNRV